MSIDLPNSVYPTAQSAASFYRALSESLRATPGVTDSGLASDLPLEEVHQGQGFSIVGREGGGTVRFKRVDHRYFETLGIPLLAGRDFDERDDARAPYVTVINEQLAAIILEKYGIADSIGQITEISTPNYENSNGEGKKAQIVGVVSERAAAVELKPMPVAYVPLAQAPETDLKVVIAVQALPSAIMPGIREAVAQVYLNLPLGNVRTMEEIRDNSLRGTKQPTLVIGMFAAVAAFLAALGLYGVLSHAVTQQRKEIGIRMALGARAIGQRAVADLAQRDGARRRRRRYRPCRRDGADALDPEPVIRRLGARPSRDSHGLRCDRPGWRGPPGSSPPAAPLASSR